jgi:hypothetical protein
MKHSKLFCRLIVALLVTTATLSLMAQDTTKTNDPVAQPSGADMAAMMELGKPGENHQIFTNIVGNWSYAGKWWVNPQSPPMEFSGTTVCKSVMGGRYFISNHNGSMTGMEYQGMAIEGYDNAKKKYVSSWIDNMGTGIENLEGTYDPATKTLTYAGSYEAMPGMNVVMHEKLNIADADHHTLAIFSNVGGAEVKIMEIVYTRKS